MLSLYGEETVLISTKSGFPLARGYRRIVQGERGDYIEIDLEQIAQNGIHVPPDQRWRIYSKWPYYIPYRPNTGEDIKIYFQKKAVGYADYKPGMFYIHPSDVLADGRPAAQKQLSLF